MSADLEAKYGVPVCPVNCLEMDGGGDPPHPGEGAVRVPGAGNQRGAAQMVDQPVVRTIPSGETVFDSIRDAARPVKKISQVSAMTGSIQNLRVCGQRPA